MNGKINYNRIDIGILIIIAVMVGFLFLALHKNYENYQTGVDEVRNYSVNQFETEYQLTLGIYESMTDVFYNILLEDENVSGLFYKGVTAETKELQDSYREELYNYLLPSYSELVKNNYRQLHFHTNKNISYIRFHKPGKYGDDLTGVRTSVEMVNKGMKKISGFEEGRIFNGYRYVYPYIHNGEQIGSVELSISMKSIIQILQDKFGIDSDMVLIKDKIFSKVFKSEQSNYLIWNVDDQFVVDKDIQDSNKSVSRYNNVLKDELNNAIDSGRKEPFSIYKRSWNDYIQLVIPMINFEDEVVGYLFSERHYEELDFRKVDYYESLTTYILIFLVLLVVLLYYDYNKKRLKNIAEKDFLTGVLMRRVLMERLDIETHRNIRYGTPLSIIMIDIDHFKDLNDKYGHKYGDMVLKRIAGIMRSNIRISDSLGRYGGEEFLIILPNTELVNAVKVAENLRSLVEDIKHEDHQRVTISCGVSEFYDCFKNSRSFIDHADVKLYESKKHGRNMVSY